ncbi:Tad domain-containing protein [Alcaligenaceae bacterium]|nr:Tad domain-containing protein [Alcaligenaceae bacterium]
MGRASVLPGSQAGQALVLGMIMVGLLAAAMLRYVMVGQVATAKSRQFHALDAAAYSGAQVQARALNMLAYINRAHTGHQVAMAHLVTLGSWSLLGDAQARQVAVGNPPHYLLGMLFGPSHGAAYAAARRAVGLKRLAATQGELAAAYASHDKTVREVLVAVQHEIVRGLPAVRDHAIRHILARNYPELPDDFRFNLSIDADAWPGYVQLQSGQGALRQLVRQAAGLYGFLGRRHQTGFNTWAVHPVCAVLRHQLRRRGSTYLDRQGIWQSVDTQSFHALRFNRWVGCYYREYPMGWGWIPARSSIPLSQPHVTNAPENFSNRDFWRWVSEATNWDIITGTGNPLATSRAASARQRWQGGGLPAHFDTSSTAARRPLLFALTLRHPGPEGLLITTQAAGQSFFARPHSRADGGHERANLFHPYWQARLASHPDAPGNTRFGGVHE